MLSGTLLGIDLNNKPTIKAIETPVLVAIRPELVVMWEGGLAADYNST